MARAAHEAETLANNAEWMGMTETVLMQGARCATQRAVSAVSEAIQHCNLELAEKYAALTEQLMAQAHISFQRCTTQLEQVNSCILHDGAAVEGGEVVLEGSNTD